MEERQIYCIGEASLITGISTKTLRYYDSIKLIVPEQRAPQTNYRYYSKNQIIQLIILHRLREMGCNLKSLYGVIKGNDISSLYQAMCNRVVELEQEIKDRKAIIRDNSDFISQLENYILMKNHISSDSANDSLLSNARIEEIPVSYLFCEERVMPHYNVVDTSVNFRVELYARCREAGLQILGPEITTYYTHLLGQFVAQDCKIRIGISVGKAPEGENIQRFGGFTAATAIHTGSYQTMVNSHMMLLRWINQNGYEVVGHVSEEFLISPINIPSQEEQLVKIIIPVAKVK